MKKIFLGFAALSLLFGVSSCANETRETAKDSKGQISFKAALGKQTRATEMDLPALKTASTTTGIPVEAFEADNTALGPWTLTWNSGTSNWDYNSGTPVAQPGGPVTYYSWYPVGIATALNATPTATAASLDYTVAATAAAQEDLLAAMTVTAFPAVGLAFNHILSQVNFAIAGVENLKVKIENIVVNDVSSTGTYGFSTTNATGWSAQATPADYAYIPAGGVNETNGTTTPTILYLGNGGGSYANSNALMLMPQTFATGDSKTFSFDFTLTDAAANGAVQATGSYIVDLGELTAAWAMGKRYVYTIDFTDYIVGGNIKFDVSVTGWADADATNIAQTVIAADATAASIQQAIGTQNAAKGTTAALTVFPIWVSDDIDGTSAIEITAIDGINFLTTDEIRIEFPSNSSLGFITLNAALNTAWTLDTSGTGRVAVLTKN